MIFNSVIAAAGSGPTLYNITNSFSSFITLDKSSAEEGETVTATLGSGYPSGPHSYNAQWPSNLVLLFVVNSGKGSNVPGDVATFTMPAADVQIVTAV